MNPNNPERANQFKSALSDGGQNSAAFRLLFAPEQAGHYVELFQTTRNLKEVKRAISCDRTLASAFRYLPMTVDANTYANTVNYALSGMAVSDDQFIQRWVSKTTVDVFGVKHGVRILQKLADVYRDRSILQIIILRILTSSIVIDGEVVEFDQEETILIAEKYKENLQSSDYLHFYYGFVSTAYAKLGHRKKFRDNFELAGMKFYRTDDANRPFQFFQKVLTEEGLIDEMFSFYNRYRRPNLPSSNLPQNLDQPFIAFCAMPKSASTYLNTILSELSQQQNISANWGMFPVERIAEVFGEHNVDLPRLISGHIAASPHNLGLLKMARRKIIVHVRNPLQALNSWHHHVTSQYQKYGNIIQFIPDSFFDRDFVAQREWLIKNYLPHFINWMEGWRQACLSETGTEINISRFEDFVSNPESHMAELIKFAGVDSTEVAISDALAKLDQQVKSAKSLQFREGLTDSWREYWTKDQQDSAISSIPESLARFYDYRFEEAQTVSH